jgi:hypothetical protein
MMNTRKEAAEYAIKKLAESDHKHWEDVVPGLTFEQLLDAILGPDITRGHEELQSFSYHRIHGRIALSSIQERFLRRMCVLEDDDE